MKTIFSFTDYREYLRYHYNWHKEKDSNYSYERFARKAGVRSPNYLKLVMDGHRNLSTTSILCFAKGLELGHFETQYFEALVLYTQCNEAYEKAYYKRRLKELRQNHSGKVSKITGAALLSHWALPAVLVCAHDSLTNEAPDRVTAMTGLPLSFIRSALSELTSTNLLFVEDERYKIHSPSLLLRDKRTAYQQRKIFLKHHTSLSNLAFDRCYEKGLGKFWAHTFTIHSDDLSHYIEKMDGLFEEFTTFADQNPSDDVLQINVQMFPFSQVASIVEARN